MSTLPSSSNFNTALAFTLQQEGGFEKAIDGIPTQFGITQPVYTQWLRDKGLPTLDVRKISLGDASKIYYEFYWEPASCEAVPYPLAVGVFDWAVNSGLTTALYGLQKAVWVVSDGVVGPDTLKAANDDSLSSSYEKAYGLLTIRREFIWKLKRYDDRILKSLQDRVSRLWYHITQIREENENG